MSHAQRKFARTKSGFSSILILIVFFAANPAWSSAGRCEETVDGRNFVDIRVDPTLSEGCYNVYVTFPKKIGSLEADLPRLVLSQDGVRTLSAILRTFPDPKSEKHKYFSMFCLSSEIRGSVSVEISYIEFSGSIFSCNKQLLISDLEKTIISD